MTVPGILRWTGVAPHGRKSPMPDLIPTPGISGFLLGLGIPRTPSSRSPRASCPRSRPPGACPAHALWPDEDCGRHTSPHQPPRRGVISQSPVGGVAGFRLTSARDAEHSSLAGSATSQGSEASREHRAIPGTPRGFLRRWPLSPHSANLANGWII